MKELTSRPRGGLDDGAGLFLRIYEKTVGFCLFYCIINMIGGNRVDERISQLIFDRDEEGLALLRKGYGGMIGYIVRGILRDSRDVEECVSDVYLRLWNNFSFDPQKGRLSTWITTVARNTALNRLKAQGHQESGLEEAGGSEDSVEAFALRRERTAELRRAIDDLSPEDTELFYRKYYYLQSTARAAAELGTTERAVEGRLYRIRKKLRQRLGGDFLDR